EDGQVRRLVEELQSATRRLAGLALGGQGAPEERQRRLERLTRRKEELEGELGRRSADFRAGRAGAVTPDDLRPSLPAPGALIDVLAYTRQDYSQPESGRRWDDRLAAFVVRRDRPVARVELGRVADLVPRLHAWQAAFRGTAADVERATGAVRRL